MQYKHHMWQYFCHIQWFSYFFLTFDGIICDCTFIIQRLPYLFLTFNGTILTLCSTNITCDCTFVTFGVSLIYFLFFTFDDTILTLCSTNITYDCTFFIFGGSLIFFFSHLMVLSPHYAKPTSHVILLCHIRWFPYVFSHIWWHHLHIVQYQHHKWLYFCHI